MMDDEAFTLEWPDGTRFALHSPPDRVPTEVGVAAHGGQALRGKHSYSANSPRKLNLPDRSEPALNRPGDSTQDVSVVPT